MKRAACVTTPHVPYQPLPRDPRTPLPPYDVLVAEMNQRGIGWLNILSLTRPQREEGYRSADGAVNPYEVNSLHWAAWALGARDRYQENS